MGFLIVHIAWTSGMAYVVVWNYLYLAKVLPALSRDLIVGADSPAWVDVGTGSM